MKPPQGAVMIPAGRNRQNNRGQATTELAIMGTIVIMALSYLLQQGFIANCRQALEMYTYRKTLQLSREKEKGISLTVVRDVFAPSFFTALNRQPLMASASIEYNPYMLYIPYAGDGEDNAPQDLSSMQLLQLNEAMIRNNHFIGIPPTRIKVKSEDGGDPKYMWTTSSVSEIDTQAERKSQYDYVTTVSENAKEKTIAKELISNDTISTRVTFEDALSIKENYMKEDKNIKQVWVDERTIPKKADLILEETVRRSKSVSTTH